jgi:hypothetical protein
VTRHGPDFVGLEALAAAGVRVQGGGAGRTTTFVNEYDAGGARRARVLAVAAPLVAPARADIVFACPVIGEVGPAALAGELVGAGLQGWLRRLGPGGVVERHVPDDVSFLAPCRVVFLSDEDLGDAQLLPRLTAVVPVVVVTHGPSGASIHAAGAVRAVAAYPAHEVDPTGAGDVFAAAFLIALAAGDSLDGAGDLAARAASVVVEDVGPAALAKLPDAALRRTRYTR